MLRNFSLSVVLVAAAVAQQPKPATPAVCEPCLKSEIEYLASDALRGRGSATADELTAANHIAENFKKLGLEPAEPGKYILPVHLDRQKFTAPPTLRFTSGGKEVVLMFGKDMLANRVSSAEIKGKLFHAKTAEDAAKVPPGSVVLIDLSDAKPGAGQQTIRAFFGTKASAVLMNDPSTWKANQERFAKELPTLPATFPGEPARTRPSFFAISPESAASLIPAPDGTDITIGGPTAPDPLETRNVVGILRGSDPTLKNEYVMFSAHMDHLGVNGTTGDTIYNGADDDASGTSTVEELARIFSKGERPKRSVMFVTFGSEELGLVGSHAFALNPPVPLTAIVAAIEFEQTGLPQENMDGHFWMTGSQLSDLCADLDKHGSTIKDDPYPGTPFFRQSDNYSLAAKGVVAHTVSGAAEFPDYHKPGDEANKLNYDFMAKALEQALPGFEWLVNTGEKPKYLPGRNLAETH